jgi:hypothetical protein
MIISFVGGDKNSQMSESLESLLVDRVIEIVIKAGKTNIVDDERASM